MFHYSAQSPAGEAKCRSFPLWHSPWNTVFIKARMPQCTEMDRKPIYPPTFSDKAGMYFSNLLNMAFLICHHYISSRCFPGVGVGRECHTLRLLLGVTSHWLLVWECNDTDQRPTDCSRGSLVSVPLEAGLSSWPALLQALTPATDTGLEGIGQVSELSVGLIGEERREEHVSVAGHQLPVSHWRR